MRNLILCAVLSCGVAWAMGAGAASADEGERSGERRARMLERWDANGDGQLDPDERAAAKQARRERRAALLEKYDEDGDGRLSPGERQAAIDSGDLRRRGGRRASPR